MAGEAVILAFYCVLTLLAFGFIGCAWEALKEAVSGYFIDRYARLHAERVRKGLDKE
jgi:hypothetical protein